MGLIDLTTRKLRLNSSDELAVAAAVEDRFADQGAVGSGARLRRTRPPAHEVGDARRVRAPRFPTGWAPCPDDVDRPAGQTASMRAPTPRRESRPGGRSRLRSAPSAGCRARRWRPARRRSPARALRGELAPHVLAQPPGAAPRSTMVCPRRSRCSASSIALQLGRRRRGLGALLLREPRTGSVGWSCSHARLSLGFLLVLVARPPSANDGSSHAALLPTPRPAPERRALAHHLDPVVADRRRRPDAAVSARSTAHFLCPGLVKVRVFSDDRRRAGHARHDLDRSARRRSSTSASCSSCGARAGPQAGAEREDRGAGPKTGDFRQVLQERQPPAPGQEGQGARQPAPRRRRRSSGAAGDKVEEGCAGKPTGFDALRPTGAGVNRHARSAA